MVDIILTLIRKQDCVIRYGGDEFLIILLNCPEDNIREKIAEVKETVKELKVPGAEDLIPQIDMGYSYNENFEKKSEILREMIVEAEKNMYIEKSGKKADKIGAK